MKNTKKKKEMSIVPDNRNKDLIQSYILTTSRNEIGLYGQRLILRLIEAANATGITKGLKFKDDDCRQVSPAEVQEDLFANYVRISLPSKAVMGDAEEYTKLSQDIKGCMHQIISYVDSDGDEVMFPFLTYAKCGKNGITVDVSRELWDAMLDFRKGVRFFELDAALHFKTAYALRFYMLMSRQKNPLTYRIQELKEILGLISYNKKGEVISEKYKNKPSDFIKYVILPTKAELDSCSPYTFDFVPIESRDRAQGRGRITTIQFFPKYQPKFRDPDLAKNELKRKYSGALAPSLDKAQENMLIHKYGFTKKGLMNNRDLFEVALKYINLSAFLTDLAPTVSKARPDNVPGYVINAIRKELNAKGIKV